MKHYCNPGLAGITRIELHQKRDEWNITATEDPEIKIPIYDGNEPLRFFRQTTTFQTSRDCANRVHLGPITISLTGNHELSFGVSMTYGVKPSDLSELLGAEIINFHPNTFFPTRDDLIEAWKIERARRDSVLEQLFRALPEGINSVVLLERYFDAVITANNQATQAINQAVQEIVIGEEVV